MAVDVLWTSAFLDLPAASFEPAVAFWSAVSGYAVSPARGASGEFATLEPGDGDAYLRVQRLADGPPRVHLDVHVRDTDAAAVLAQELGAVVVHRSEHGYVVCRSPAGIVHCFVSHSAGRRPRPAAWGGHRSVVDQVALDLSAADADAEIAYWHRLTGWEHRVASPVYSALVRPAGQPLRLMFHRVGDDRSPATAHLDLACDDRPAEVERHVALGARTSAVDEHFTVLSDAGGSAYCITDRDPDTGVL